MSTLVVYLLVRSFLVVRCLRSLSLSRSLAAIHFLAIFRLVYYGIKSSLLLSHNSFGPIRWLFCSEISMRLKNFPFIQHTLTSCPIFCGHLFSHFEACIFRLLLLHTSILRRRCCRRHLHHHYHGFMSGMMLNLLFEQWNAVFILHCSFPTLARAFCSLPSCLFVLLCSRSGCKDVLEISSCADDFFAVVVVSR